MCVLVRADEAIITLTSVIQTQSFLCRHITSAQGCQLAHGERFCMINTSTGWMGKIEVGRHTVHFAFVGLWVYVCVCYFEVMQHSGVFSEGSVIYCLFLHWHWDNTLPLRSSCPTDCWGGGESNNREDGKREENSMDGVKMLWRIHMLIFNKAFITNSCALNKERKVHLKLQTPCRIIHSVSYITSVICCMLQSMPTTMSAVKMS